MGTIRKKDGSILNKEMRDQKEIRIKNTLNLIKNKILVMSGKGGVGKSSIAAYLAVSLAALGHKVGLMDVDLHGPSIPRMLGLSSKIKPEIAAGKMLPIRHSANLHVISIESLMGDDKDTATIWRGPLKIGVIKQFIGDIEWGNMDYMIIDSPPGTGDEPLTVGQTIPDAKALIVTTPQEISLADVRKSINFCREINMEILGLVENMSGLICPYCGKRIEVFKVAGGARTAKNKNLRLLASLPLEPEIVKSCDQGNLEILDHEDNLFVMEFNKMVQKIVQLTSEKTG